ncbi:MAG: glycosyltransferase [Armatimonadetes bacterium]|nr:glycosyltransferase [Armatimonadota bacterium]
MPLFRPPYRVAVDLHSLQTPSSRHRGIGRYVAGLLDAILAVSSLPIEWVFYGTDAFPAPELDLRGYSLHLLPGQKLLAAGGDGAVTQLDTVPLEAIYRTQLLKDNVDAVFLPSPMEGNDCAIPDLGDFPARLYAVSLDLIPLIYADRNLTNPQMHQMYHRRLRNLRSADAVFAISEATRQDTMRLLHVSNENAHTIYAGFSSFFTPLPAAERDDWRKKLRTTHGIGNRFLLYNGGADWRKNQEGLIEAFAVLPKDVSADLQLVCTCRFSEEYAERLNALAAKCGIARRNFVLTGYVPDDELRALYSLCDLFVYPSLHEGFGLPIAEAMLCGAPTIVANNSSLPEVVGDPDALFVSNSVPAMAEKIAEMLRSPARLAAMRETAPGIAGQFTWERSAKLLLAPMLRDLEQNAQTKPPANIAYRRLRNRSAAHKPVVAMVSPFPPARSGISDYTAELLPELSTHFEILPVLSPGHPPVAPDAPFRPYTDAPMEQEAFETALFDAASAGEIASRALPCDMVIHQMGNSSWHTDSYSLLTRFPGITVLHDYSMNGLLATLHGERADLAVSLDAELQHAYTDVSKRSVAREAIRSGDFNRWEKLVEQGLYSNRRIFTRSLGVVVHSHATLKEAVRDFGSDCELITRIPQLMQAPSEPVSAEMTRAKRATLNLSSSAFVVVAVGFVHENKRSLPLLEAFRQFLAVCPDAHLVFAGSDEIYNGSFSGEIERRGLAQKVTVTGYVPMETLYDAIDAADLCVSLRYPSNGETSAGLLRILSRGKACLASEIGSFTDYPDTVCAKIPAVPQIEGDEAGAICASLVELYRNAPRRESLAQSAWEYVRREHDPARCARLYAEFVEAVQKHPLTPKKLLADYAARELASAWVRVGRWGEETGTRLPRLLSALLKEGA